MNVGVIDEESRWKEMTGEMVIAAREMCGVVKKEVANPCTIEDEEIKIKKKEIKVTVRKRTKSTKKGRYEKIEPWREDV